LSLTPAQRRRFVRHVLLPEIGPRGQARLLDARFAFSNVSGATEVAALYLERAGLTAADADDERSSIELPATEDPIEAALVGAWAAVEHVKRVLALGKSVHTPPKVDRCSTRESE